ncbi:hypothetical protein [Vibrio fluvialis]|uniref:hypothetical protein n=1 Tax=Vibrio fluvialis TaxID=676 RepID=UPI00301CB304
MKQSLEAILIFGCLELEGSSKSVVVDAFSEAMNCFLSSDEIFQKLPELVYIGCDELRENSLNFEANSEESGRITYFQEPATLVYDGIKASAFGRMNYIYRTKGVRLYLTKSGILDVLTPYCTIDDDGFQLHNEVWDSYGPDFNEMTVDDVRRLIHFTSEDYNIRDPKQFVCGELIKMLCSVKQSFIRDYFLEYLITPPDVDRLSEFSVEVRSTLWSICLSESFREKWGEEVQHTAMNILSSQGVSPTTGQVVEFLKASQSKENTLEQILSKLDEIQDHMSVDNQNDDIDLFELKPNICGIGININELYKRARESAKKT